MKTLSKITVMGLIMLAAGVAQAQTPPQGRPGMGGTPEQRQAMMAERQAKLHDALKLSAAQEGAWTAYTDAVKAAMGNTDREAGREARQKAEASFAATLSAEQKAVLEAQRGQRGQGGGQRNGQGGGQGGMAPAGQ